MKMQSVLLYSFLLFFILLNYLLAKEFVRERRKDDSLMLKLVIKLARIRSLFALKAGRVAMSDLHNYADFSNSQHTVTRYIRHVCIHFEARRLISKLICLIKSKSYNIQYLCICLRHNLTKITNLNYLEDIKKTVTISILYFLDKIELKYISILSAFKRIIDLSYQVSRIKNNIVYSIVNIIYKLIKVIITLLVKIRELFKDQAVFCSLTDSIKKYINNDRIVEILNINMSNVNIVTTNKDKPEQGLNKVTPVTDKNFGLRTTNRNRERRRRKKLKAKLVLSRIKVSLYDIIKNKLLGLISILLEMGKRKSNKHSMEVNTATKLSLEEKVSNAEIKQKRTYNSRKSNNNKKSKAEHDKMESNRKVTDTLNFVASQVTNPDTSMNQRLPVIAKTAVSTVVSKNRFASKQETPSTHSFGNHQFDEQSNHSKTPLFIYSSDSADESASGNDDSDTENCGVATTKSNKKPLRAARLMEDSQQNSPDVISKSQSFSLKNFFSQGLNSDNEFDREDAENSKSPTMRSPKNNTSLDKIDTHNVSVVAALLTFEELKSFADVEMSKLSHYQVNHLSAEEFNEINTLRNAAIARLLAAKELVTSQVIDDNVVSFKPEQSRQRSSEKVNDKELVITEPKEAGVFTAEGKLNETELFKLTAIELDKLSIDILMNFNSDKFPALNQQQAELFDLKILEYRENQTKFKEKMRVIHDLDMKSLLALDDEDLALIRTDQLVNVEQKMLYTMEVNVQAVRNRIKHSKPRISVNDEDMDVTFNTAENDLQSAIKNPNVHVDSNAIRIGTDQVLKCHKRPKTEENGFAGALAEMRKDTVQRDRRRANELYRRFPFK